jgi:hypothetical protein
VCALAQDFSQELDFLERNLIQCASRTPEELLRFSEAAPACLSFPLEQVKIRKKGLWNILLQRVSAKVK